jgi:hypothetical protein
MSRLPGIFARFHPNPLEAEVPPRHMSQSRGESSDTTLVIVREGTAKW